MLKSENVGSVTEGKTRVLVFKKKVSKKGPGSKERMPFYNPAMELNRDFSVVVGQWLINNSRCRVKFLDGLAASGIRGLRFLNELDGDFEVFVNDWDKYSYELIKKNFEKCEKGNVFVTNKNLNALLSENKFHYIDVDPFGSPVGFIDSALRSIYNDGVLACTATDTATLCGVYPKVCLRRYGARPLHSDVMHETGLRILLSFICREAGKYDKGIEPLVCYSTDYYFRLYVRIKHSVDYANESIDNLSIVNSKKIGSYAGKSVDVGPLWMGKMYDKRVLQELRTILFKKELKTKHEIWKLLSLFEDEADAPAFFYTVSDLTSSLKKSAPKMKIIFEKLREKGYVVAGTHFSPNGFKTDAPLNEIKKLFK
jgi:tRNA (guanine26-N2/guanine27-N2)-dimethyltransferase